MRYVHVIRRFWAAGLVSLTLSGGGSLGAIEPPSSAALDGLVKQLAAPRFKDRDAAARKLEAIGTSALPSLRRALQSGDAEMQRRAAELVAMIESRNASAAILAPTVVHLKASNSPLVEVLRDLAQQSGIRLLLAPEPADLGGRAVTLDTGKISFWEALDSLCRQAKIHLRPLFQEAAPTQPEERSKPIPVVGGVIPESNGVDPEWHRLVLDDGSPPQYPTAYLGSVRLRLLPHRSYVSTAAVQKGCWAVEVLSEPKVQWQGSVALFWDEAVRGDEQRLAAVPRELLKERNKPHFAESGLLNVLKNGGIVNLGRMGNDGEDDEVVAPRTPQDVRRHEILLKWNLPPDACGQTAVLRGRLKGMALAETAAVETNDVKKAGSNPIAGKEGFHLTIRNFQQSNDRKVEVEVAIESPARPGAQQAGAFRQKPGGFQLQGGGFQMQFQFGNGGGIIQPGGGRPAPSAGRSRPVRNPGFHVWDDKGRPYQILVHRLSAKDKVADYRLTLTPPAKDSVPMKLEFHAHCPAGVEQPFVFRSIRLP